MDTATQARANQAAKALNRPVNALLLAKAYAQCEREKMDKVDLRLLADRVYMDQYAEGKRITEPKDTWHMNETDAAHYQKLRQTEIDRMGYKLPRDHCPALVAEYLETQAEWAVVDAAAEFFPGVDRDGLLCLGLEKYHQFIDLVCKLVVNAPGYVPAKMPC